MRDDICPPDSSIEDKWHSCMERNRSLGNALSRLHEQAKTMGYETVYEAMDSLAAMKRGPRSIPVDKQPAQTGKKA